MKEKIWLSPPHMGGGELEFVQKAFDENWVAPLGPNVNGLEDDLENFLGEGVYASVLSSGTAALHIALVLAGVTHGDSVLCQSLTFTASANPIVYLGATPIFIDSEKDTWNMCPSILEDAVLREIKKGKKPKAIVVVNLYGMPYRVQEIMEIAQKYGIILIDDSAEALGSRYRGQKCGTHADFSVISFNGNKIITTSGGGALITKSRENKEKAIYFATQAKDHAPHYEHSQLGYNYRMSNISAGIGRGQMRVLEDRIEKRRENFNFYKDIFKNYDEITLFSEPSDDFFSNHWLNAIQIDPNNRFGITPEKIRLEFEIENIEARPLWKPMHLQPLYREALYYGGQCSDDLFKNGLCLPSGTNMSSADKQRIADCLASIFS